MTGAALSLEMLQKTFNDLNNAAFDSITRQPMLLCHPLELPFFKAIFDDNQDIDKVMRLKDECFRKWNMGSKRGIAKWSMKELVAQYTDRLRSVPR